MQSPRIPQPKSFLPFIILLILWSCNQNTECMTYPIKGNITAVHFDARLNVEEEALIHLDVEHPENLCVHEVIPDIKPIGTDTFYISARLLVSESGESCACLEEIPIRTQLLFKSSRRGNYVFLYNDAQSNVASESGRFEIQVE